MAFIPICTLNANPLLHHPSPLGLEVGSSLGTTISGIVLFTGLVGYGQGDRYNKIAATLDLGGNGGGYCLNGEFELLAKEKYLLNTRLGFGYIPVKNTQFMAIPFGFNILTGKGKHHFEGGLGLSYIKGLTFKTIQIGDSQKCYFDEAAYFVPSVWIFR